MESNVASTPVRRALITLGVLVSVAVVAVASRGSTSVGDARTRRPADALLDILFTLYVILLVVGAVFFVYLLALQRGLRQKAGIGPMGRLSMLVYAFILLVALAGLQRLREAGPRPIEEDDFLAPELPTTVPQATTAQATDTRTAEFAWIPVIVFVTLLVVAVAAFWWASARHRRAGAVAEPAALAEELADVLEETLDDLRAEQDPRRAVIAAYARLERVLAAHGIPRRPAEAPLEYLGRVLRGLSVSAEAVRQLTLLFQRAKFSHHEVGPEMKVEAIDALEKMQNELRAAEALARQERERAAQLALDRTRAAG